MKYIAYLVGGLCAAASGAYLALYLYRWEWQRATICGLILVTVEGILVCAVLLGRMGRIERRIAEGDARVEEITRHLEHTRKESATSPFRWLATGPHKDGPGSGTNRTFVFVPMLLATGVVLTGVAWVIRRLAATTRPGAERRLAGRLAPLAAPLAGVYGPLPQLEDRPAVPEGRPLHVLLAVVGSGALVVLLILGVHVLEEATETRAEKRPDAAATTIVFQVEVHGPSGPVARDLAARALWGVCSRSTRQLSANSPLSRLSDGIYAGLVRPALGAHDTIRLRGCLSDAAVNRASAVVLGDGHAERPR